MQESNVHTTRDIFQHIYIDSSSYISLSSHTIQQNPPNATVGFIPTRKNTKEIKNADNDARLSKSTLKSQFLNPTRV
jgi:hypothetical protein